MGLLVLLCVVALFGLIRMLKRERYTTRAGDDALASLRTTLDRAIRAPRVEELALAFAVGGAAVLSGTEHADYAKFINASGAAMAVAADRRRWGRRMRRLQQLKRRSVLSPR